MNPKKRYFLLIGVLGVCSTHAQLQIGYHYKIYRKTPLVYTYSDTTRNTNGKITQIDVHTYVPNGKAYMVEDRSNDAYLVRNHYYPGLVLCVQPLKAAIHQKEDDPSGKVQIEFWGIKNETGCNDPKYINRSRKLGQFYYQIKPKLTLGDITQFQKFKYATTEVGIVTVPFKFRFGYTKDTIHVPNDASANASIAGYIGRKWGSTSFYADKARTTNSVAFTAAYFLGPSVITVSSENAFPTKDSIITRQLKTKANELGLSTGIAGTLSLRNFNIGAYVGIDIPLTGNSDRWYYANRPWIGIGFGYKLAMLGEK